jgi:2-Cys peroxiredoxin 5
VEKADEFAAKGVKGIYIVSVNDAFTTQAWKEKHQWNSPLVHFLADDQGKVSGSGMRKRDEDTADSPLHQFTRESGLDFDATGLLGGHRSQRYAAVVEDGEVRRIFVEDAAPQVTVTAASNVLQAL